MADTLAASAQVLWSKMTWWVQPHLPRSRKYFLVKASGHKTTAQIPSVGLDFSGINDFGPQLNLLAHVGGELCGTHGGDIHGALL